MLENVGISKKAVEWIVPVIMGDSRDCFKEVTDKLEYY